MSRSVVLITGAGGFLGSLLARALLSDVLTPNVKLILVDVVEPTAPAGANAITIKADLTDPTQAEGLFRTEFGVPDTVYCLHGIMSRGSEDHFDFGIKVNVDSVRTVLDATRHAGAQSGALIKFIFTSSLAVYGGPLPPVITPDTIATPQGAYGMAKLVDEIFINEYTRRGFVDGRILRLPTIVVRAGRTIRGYVLFHVRAPGTHSNKSARTGIIREPLRGEESVCPIGDSLDSPVLDTLAFWVASPETTIRNIVFAKHVPADKFLAHTRVVCLPGFTTTVREEVAALEQVAGREAVAKIRFEDDQTNRRIVSSWPARFDNSYALSLGFAADEGGMVPIVQRFKEQMLAGEV